MSAQTCTYEVSNDPQGDPPLPRATSQGRAELTPGSHPKATIALFGGARFRTDPLLHSLINGESVLNDAVAIALFATLSRHLDEEDPRIFSVSVLGSFFLVSAFSLVLGLAAGAFCSWCFTRSRSLGNFPEYEISAMCLGCVRVCPEVRLTGAHTDSRPGRHRDHT